MSKLVALVGGESLLGADLRDRLAALKPEAQIKLVGSDAEPLLTEEGGEAVVMTGVDEESLGGAAVVVLAGSAESSRKAFAILEKQRRTVTIVDATAALEDLPDARVRAPQVEPKNVPYSRIQVVAHPGAILLARLMVAAKNVKNAVAVILAPASEHGRPGVVEMQRQTVQLLGFQALETKVFGQQATFNMLAGVLGDTERIIERHSASLLGPFGKPLPSVRLIQAPVMHGYSVCLWLDGIGDLDREGIDLWPDDAPTPVGVAGESGVSVGAIERDRNHPSAVWMWAVTDQFRLTADNAFHLVRAAL